MPDLNSIWFAVITFFFVTYFVLDGFDFGTGIMLPVLGKTDRERRIIINTIGPVWDGNEVWLVGAGSAMLAAFPDWYATLFSAFYPAIPVMLAALMLRGVGFEFRSKRPDSRWRSFWDWAIASGSATISMLWGIILASFIQGIPVDASKQFTGSITELLSPYALLCGITSTSMFTLHGTLFVALKTTGALEEKARRAAGIIWIPTTILCLLFLIYTYLETGITASLGINPGIIPVTSVLALLSVMVLLQKKLVGWAFAMSCTAIGFSAITIFLELFPNVIVSSLNRDWNLTIYNSATSGYTLGIISNVALFFVPLILLYQGWSYWVFRKRITGTNDLEY